jgi:hypothetical protein
MFIFSNIYNLSIIKDFSNLVNVTQYHILKNVQGDVSKLSFLNTKIKKEHKKKIKNLIILEFIGLQKSFLQIYTQKGLKKTIYKMIKTCSFLNKKLANYYLFNFLKHNIGAMHALLKFALTTNLEQKNINLLTCFDIIFKKKTYFKNIKELSYERSYHYYNNNSNHSLAFLSFYKKAL